MRRTYLDWAAAAPVHPKARKAFLDALKAYGNPSSPHEEGRQARDLLEDARKRIARLAGARPEQVIFTSGATEANALALRGFAKAQRASGREPGSIRMLYHPGAHASVAGAMEALSSEGIDVRTVPLAGGEIDERSLAPLLRDAPALVSLEAASPETGQRHDTRRIGRVAREAGSVLHVDASQLPLVEDISRERLGADLLTLDAQKAGGVRGIGCLILSSRASLAPLMEGGGQERGLRPGTPSPALAAAFAAALEAAAVKRERFTGEAVRLRSSLVATVLKELPGAVVNEGREQVPHIANLSFTGRDTDYLVALLDERGFAVSAKSACESDSAEGSRAVRVLAGDAVRARATLRVSWGPATPAAALRRFARALVEAVRFLERNEL